MINAIIIDDEDDARKSLQTAIVRYCPDVHVTRLCCTPEEGIDAINERKPDLVFLDIQMPRLSGFDVLARVGSVTFDVIFVSAYDHYAIKAIRFSALDYLLKPVDVDDLVQAVRRKTERGSQAIQSHHYQSAIQNLQFRGGAIPRLAVPSSEGIDVFETGDIIFCHAEGSYTTLFLTGNRKKLVTKNLKDFETILSDSGFCRVHHSSLINLKHVQKYVKGEGGYAILTEGHHVDISRRKKDEFIGMLDKV